MEPRIHVITLTVGDLERSLRFYRALGLESDGIVGTEFEGDGQTPAGDVAMFRLRGGMILALYPRTELAKDAGIGSGGRIGSGAFSLGHNVSSEADVDALLARAEAAGATLTDRPHRRPWGAYSGYFEDPDGHLWEVVHNPGLDLGEA